MITVIGYDGTPLSADAGKALGSATLVVGGHRHLAAVEVPAGAQVVEMGNVAAALDALAAHDGEAVVLASGDPGFFGIVRSLRDRGVECAVLPAVSSVSLAFGRAALAWDDALVVSAHGRELAPVVNACWAHPKVAVLTSPAAGPAELGAALAGLPRHLVVCERLGEPDERVTTVEPADAAERRWTDPSVVLVLDEDVQHSRRGWVWPRPATPDRWALPEEQFRHRDSMVTKAEVRALALARLAPRVGSMVWDVGAGSGSVAIECARFGSAVVAVERDVEQCARIEANARAHGVHVHVVEGEAPAVLDALPQPDSVFVGGGGPEVVAAVAARRPDRVVVALAALERFGATCGVLTSAGYGVAGVQLQASRLAVLPDGSHRLAATNPVLLVWTEPS